MPDDQHDDLRPARGIILGCLLGSLAWCVILALIFL